MCLNDCVIAHHWKKVVFIYFMSDFMTLSNRSGNFCSQSNQMPISNPLSYAVVTACVYRTGIVVMVGLLLVFNAQPTSTVISRWSCDGLSNVNIWYSLGGANTDHLVTQIVILLEHQKPSPKGREGSEQVRGCSINIFIRLTMTFNHGFKWYRDKWEMVFLMRKLYLSFPVFGMWLKVQFLDIRWKVHANDNQDKERQTDRQTENDNQVTLKWKDRQTDRQRS